MIGLLPLICLFLTIFSTFAIQIRPSLHRHNGGESYYITKKTNSTIDFQNFTSSSFYIDIEKMVTIKILYHRFHPVISILFIFDRV